MESKKLFFDVDSTSIQVKKMLNKEFLEIKLRAISDVKPNLNGSWFTKESLELSKDTVYNKPVLGHYQNNDFNSHDGEWRKDSELNIDYWDNKEVALGLIRESDYVAVEHDEKTNLNWLTFSAALWINYAYKQSKKLIKNMIKSIQNGSPNTSVSVEVDVVDYDSIIDETTGQPIMKINQFNLIGITILGRKVTAGIPGAELTVSDLMNTEMFNNNMKSLRVAYAKLDGKEETNVNELDEKLVPEITPEPPVEKTEEETEVKEEECLHEEEHVEEIPEKEECIESEEEVEAEKVEDEPVEEEHVEEDCEDEEKEEIHEDECDDDCEHQEYCENVQPVDTEHYSVEELRDLSWVLRQATEFQSQLGMTMEYYEGWVNSSHDYVVAHLENWTVEVAKIIAEIGTVIGEISNADFTITEEAINHLKELREANKEELIKENKELSNCCEVYAAKIAEKDELNNKLEKDLFLMNSAKEIEKSETISEEQKKQIYSLCENGELTDSSAVQEEIKTAEIEAEKLQPTEKTTEFASEIQKAPTVTIVEKAEKSTKKTSWDVLHEYTSK